MWTQVLGLADIGIDDDFFAIGGESLSAIMSISKIPTEDADITLVDLYNNPTIRQLAIRIDESTDADHVSILVRLTSKKQKIKTPMICFPYGGENVISYRNMSDSASLFLPDLALYAVNLPGHDVGGDTAFRLYSQAEHFRLCLQEYTGGSLIHGSSGQTKKS